jgi:hypothetical protein
VTETRCCGAAFSFSYGIDWLGYEARENEAVHGKYVIVARIFPWIKSLDSYFAMTDITITPAGRQWRVSVWQTLSLFVCCRVDRSVKYYEGVGKEVMG